MMKTALRRGGRLIAVTALATAFLGSTAGANDLPPAPEADAQADASAQEQAMATATAGAQAETQRQAQCKMIAVGRDASFNYFLSSKNTGRKDANAAVHGDASLEVCYDLDVTVGATVNIALGQDATATASAAASAPPPTASDAENACVNGSVGLLGDAGATAVGTVKAKVAASASAGTLDQSEGTSAGSANADADGDGWLTVDVSLTVSPEEPPSDNVATGACLKSAGDLVDP